MTTELNILQLVMQASLVVQLVLLILLAASLYSWAVIFNKWRLLRRAVTADDRFEGIFWQTGDLSPFYEKQRTLDRPTGLARIFVAGFKEFARLREQQGMDPQSVLEGAQRAMRVALNRELDYLESHLPFLATVGSTSPYIGLFGTVWGIMGSFQALGNVHQATIAMVAPGISEALVATAMGLFAAIPAVIGYNRYTHQLDHLAGRYDVFLEEFSSILQRHVHA